MSFNLVGEFSEWIKFIVAMLGFAVGYGTLKNKVSNLEAEHKEHKRVTSKQIEKVQAKIDLVERDVSQVRVDLKGVNVGVSHMSKVIDKIDGKLDKILEGKQ